MGCIEEDENSEHDETLSEDDAIFDKMVGKGG